MFWRMVFKIFQKLFHLCCGSGSTCIWASCIRIRLWILIRIILLLSKNIMENLIFTILVLWKTLFLTGFSLVSRRSMMKIWGSGSAEPNTHPDPDAHLDSRIRINTKNSWIRNTWGGDPLGIMVVYPGYSFLPYQFPGLKKAPYPGSRSATLVEIAAVGSLRTR